MFYLQKFKNEALKLNKVNYEGLINLTENCTNELLWERKSVGSVNDISHLLTQLTYTQMLLQMVEGLLVESTHLGEIGLRRNHHCTLMCQK